MNFLATINYESGETQGRYIFVADDVQNATELKREVRAAINSDPIYAPWNSIECSPIDTMKIGGKELDVIRITPDKSIWPEDVA